MLDRSILGTLSWQLNWTRPAVLPSRCRGGLQKVSHAVRLVGSAYADDSTKS